MAYIHQLATIDFNALRKYRVTTLQKAMKDYGIDAYLCCLPGNIRYMTDYFMFYELGAIETAIASLLFQNGDPYLFPWSGDYLWIEEKIDWIPKDHIRPLRAPIGGMFIRPEALAHFLKHLTEIFEREGVRGGRIAIDMMPYALGMELKNKLPSFEIVDDQSLRLKRASKCEEEIKLIKMSTAITNNAAAVALNMLKEGVKECEVAAAIAHYYYKENVDWLTWSPQVLSGPNVAPYFRLTTDRRLQYGDPWYFDIGAQFLGYCSTISLFGTVGKPTEQQREIYKALYDSTQAVLKILRPGVTTADVFLAGEKVLEEYGYKKYIREVPDIPFIPGISPLPPSLGWGADGIGTLSHEPPNISGLSLDKPVRIERNMAFRFHPNLFIPGIGGGRLKNVVVVRETGPEVLTKTFEYGAMIFDYP
ncbi:MAG: Xaa-Pro peptidase family protein [Candidatus Bathyarchaeia archaeon]